MENLYRLYDANDELLYVGISKSALKRLGEHYQTKEWADQIATMTIEQYPDRNSVEKAEQTAISKENPVHNKRRQQLVAKTPRQLWELATSNERIMVGHLLNVVAHELRNERLFNDRDYYSTMPAQISISRAISLVASELMEENDADVNIMRLYKTLIVTAREQHSKTAQRYEKDDEIAHLKARVSDLTKKIQLANKALKESKASCVFPVPDYSPTTEIRN